MALRLVFGAAPLLALAGLCANPAGPSDPGRELAENRARWERQGIRDYRYVFSRMCFCPPPVTAPVEVTVKNGAIVAARLAQTGEELPPERWGNLLTVDGVFQTIRSALDRRATIRVSYDPGRGFPVQAFIDPSARAVDDEETLRINDFTSDPAAQRRP